MQKKNILIIIIVFCLAAPSAALALEMPLGLQMPTSGSDLAQMFGINAASYIVEDTETGQILISKNENTSWTPASLTKLVTALVVLDTNPNLNKTVTMTSADQVAGFCSGGGSCIKSSAGVKFTVDGLFHALLMPSANNAANALARSTGLSASGFVEKMNQKVAALGATQSHFNEPTGMDPNNAITASDYTKIIMAAFNNPYLSGIAQQSSYFLRSANNSRYNQTIKNTDQLVTDADVQILGAKTGYLTQSGYNFASLIRYQGGDELAVVVLGEDHLYMAFAETKELADLAEQTQELALINQSGAVLGTSTAVSIVNN